MIRWLLAPGRLELELSKEASDALELDTELTIEFDAQHVADLEEWLPKVLEKTRSSSQTRPTRTPP